jgi:ribosome-associated translation inhibitor RaiA
MQIPLQITFRGMTASPAVESLIRRRSARLEHFHDRIIRCHVVIDTPHQHSRKERGYTVHLDITTPTGPIAISHDHGADPSHHELDIAVRNAFDTATRRLEDEVRRHRPA